MAASTNQAIQYLVKDEDPRILGATLSITVIALLTMVARIFVRVKMIHDVGWDDYFMCASTLFCLTWQCLIVPEVLYGAGRHRDQVPPEDFQEGFKLSLVTQSIILFAICLFKVAVGFFLLWIAVVSFDRRAFVGITAFMALYTIACFLTIMLQCTNLAVLWGPTVKGTCWTANTLKALSYTNVALNITIDILFAIAIPKSSVIGILTLGTFGTVAALVKVDFLPDYGKTGDWLRDSRNITIWTVLESNVGIIAGNLPCLKSIFRSVLGSTYGRGSRNRTTSRYLSRPYGAGTGHHKSAKSNNYNSLASSKDRGPQLSQYGEPHMMTKIAADKIRNSSANSIQDDNGVYKNSVESVILLQDQSKGFGKFGGIVRTTEVSTEYNTPVSSVRDAEGPERRAEPMV